MKCTACNKDINRKEVVYNEDAKAYCPNPFTCNDDHPNSVTNIIGRGAAVKLYTEDELEDNIFERLSISDEMKERILKVATKPQSIRLSKYEIAHYLLALQEEEELASISESVRFCVTLAMQVRPLGRRGKLVPVQPKPEPADIPVLQAESVDAEELKEKATKLVLNGEKVIIPDIPKSVNVDWNNLTKVEEEQESEQEDEFTF